MKLEKGKRYRVTFEVTFTREGNGFVDVKWFKSNQGESFFLYSDQLDKAQIEEIPND